MNRYAILEAPSNLGLGPTGVEHASTALVGLGLAERLRAKYAGRIEAPPFDPVRDPDIRILNVESIAKYTVMLARAVEPMLSAGEFPVVLGGDCSILLGSLLALRPKGRYGLLFLDGHSDFWTPETEPRGEAASMDLALATGRGPSLLTDIEGQGPLVTTTDVLAIGTRDYEFDPDYAVLDGSSLIPRELGQFTLADFRKFGLQTGIRKIIEFLARPELDGVWVHLDVDVLDDSMMPAVDYRMPNGLTWAELVACLNTVISSGCAMGLEVTIYNPTLDPELSAGRELVNALIEGLMG